MNLFFLDLPWPLADPARAAIISLADVTNRPLPELSR